MVNSCNLQEGALEYQERLNHTLSITWGDLRTGRCNSPPLPLGPAILLYAGWENGHYWPANCMPHLKASMQAYPLQLFQIPRHWTRVSSIWTWIGTIDILTLLSLALTKGIQPLTPLRALPLTAVSKGHAEPICSSGTWQVPFWKMYRGALGNRAGSTGSFITTWAALSDLA